jgi:hypothetical protein
MAFQKQIGVLWLKEKQREDGTKFGYMTGYIDNGIHGNIPIVIFRIRDKQHENGPDYRMLLSQPVQQQGAAPPDGEEEQPPITDDDIPF